MCSSGWAGAGCVFLTISSVFTGCCLGHQLLSVRAALVLCICTFVVQCWSLCYWAAVSWERDLLLIQWVFTEQCLNNLLYNEIKYIFGANACSGAFNTTILTIVEYCYLPEILEKRIPLRTAVQSGKEKSGTCSKTFQESLLKSRCLSRSCGLSCSASIAFQKVLRKWIVGKSHTGSEKTVFVTVLVFCYNWYLK